MLPISVDTFRLTLHILGAAVWVGGQLTLGGLVPVLRDVDPDAPKLAARRFSWIAWAGFSLAAATGIWNLFAINVGATTVAFQITLGVKLVLVALAGISAVLHSISTSSLGLAVWGAVGLLSGLGAMFVGVLLAGS